MDDRSILVSVEGIDKTFASKSGITGRRRSINAVRDVSFEVRQRQSVGLVGESGSGKTTIARIILGLTQPSAGRVRFGWADSDSRTAKRRIRAVFQDPFTSLDPHQSAYKMLEEVQRLLFARTPSERLRRSRELLDRVGLSDQEGHALPKELSGGQRQRVAIARALCAEPTLVVLDEAVSALDVSIQAQILNLLSELADDLRLTYLVISHDLAVINQLCDEVIVLYRGMVMERGKTDDVLGSPGNPYTRMLLESVPRAGMTLRRRLALVEREREGCVFRSRCQMAVEACAEMPPLSEVGGSREVRCWLPLVSGQPSLRESGSTR
ncbi:MAG: ABC transporter ATP-binding protein [Streptosporangiaceae bacterium]